MRITWIGLEAGDSKYSHVGQIWPSPIPKFCHVLPIAFDIAALGTVLIVPRLSISEIWMGKLMMIHPLGVQLLQVLIMILMMMWCLGLPSTLIMVQGTLIERGS